MIFFESNRSMSFYWEMHLDVCMLVTYVQRYESINYVGSNKVDNSCAAFQHGNFNSALVFNNAIRVLPRKERRFVYDCK